MRPLNLKEKEYRLSLLRTERRAIIPIKWFVWVVTVGLWFTLVDPWPAGAVIGTFAIYGALTLVQSYWFYRGPVRLKFIRPLTLTSYLIDVVYVSLLVYFSIGGAYGDETLEGVQGAVSHYSDFYILYFLLVMRGFALFSTLWETALVNTLISLLFIGLIRLQQASFAFVTEPAFAVRLVLIWLVLLLGWFIIVVLNQQKLDLIRVQEQLSRTENLVRIGELAAGVAHEINNPIGIIIANTEYLKKIADPADPRLEDIEAIHRESNRCKEIVQQLLAYANPRPGESVPVDAREVNDEVLQFIFPKGKESAVEVVKEYSTPLPGFMADPNLVKQALLNIYINARQALPAGGRIVSRIRSGTFPAMVTIEIEDNGPGIPPEDLDHVFDPYFTRKKGGTGLGLATAQRIVESFNGTIAIQAAQPAGTVVAIQFPAIRLPLVGPISSHRSVKTGP